MARRLGGAVSGLLEDPRTGRRIGDRRRGGHAGRPVAGPAPGRPDGGRGGVGHQRQDDDHDAAGRGVGDGGLHSHEPYRRQPAERPHRRPACATPTPPTPRSRSTRATSRGRCASSIRPRWCCSTCRATSSTACNEVRGTADRWRTALADRAPGLVVANADDPLVVWAVIGPDEPGDAIARTDGVGRRRTGLAARRVGLPVVRGRPALRRRTVGAARRVAAPGPRATTRCVDGVGRAGRRRARRPRPRPAGPLGAGQRDDGLRGHRRTRPAHRRGGAGVGRDPQHRGPLPARRLRGRRPRPAPGQEPGRLERPARPRRLGRRVRWCWC